MNKIIYYIYRLYQIMGDYILHQGVKESVVRYKYKHGKEFTMAERMTVLADVDKVLYGEMLLSEYVEKWGTVYVDDKFQKPFIVERPKNKINFAKI